MNTNCIFVYLHDIDKYLIKISEKKVKLKYKSFISCMWGVF